MRVFFILHWSIPWFCAAVGLYALVRLVRGYVNESAFTDRDQRFIRIYGGLMDLQATVGLIYFFWNSIQNDDFQPYRYLLHGLTMFAAILIPHFSTRWNNTDDPTRYIKNFFLLLSSLLLIVLGLALVPAK